MGVEGGENWLFVSMLEKESAEGRVILFVSSSLRIEGMDLTNMRIAYVSRHRGGSRISPSYEKSSRQFS